MVPRIDPTVLRALGVRLAVLFGSQATGLVTEDSDVDVGVLLGRATPDLLDPLRTDLVTAIGASGELDLVFLDEAEPLLLFEVARSGTPLFQEIEGTWENFRILAVKRYYDTAWIRRIEADALHRRYA